MEFYKDLRKIEKSKSRIVLGLLLTLISIVWVIIKINQNGNLDLLDWSYSGIIALNGILHIIEGNGISSSKLFGKAFIIINSEKVSIKTGAFSKENYIYWNEIETINYKINNIVFNTKSNKSLTIQSSMLDYLSIIEMKKIISEIAKQMEIQNNLK